MARSRRRVGVRLAGVSGVAAVVAASLGAAPVADAEATVGARSPAFTGPSARVGSIEDPDVVEPAARDVRAASFRFSGGTGTAVVQLGAQPDAATAATLRVHHGRWREGTCAHTPESVTSVRTLDVAQDGRVEVALTPTLPLWSLDCAGVALVPVEGSTPEVYDSVETELAAEVARPPGVLELAVRPRALRVGRDAVRVSVRNVQGGTATGLRLWVRGDGVRSRGKVRVGTLEPRRRASVVVPVRVERGPRYRTVTVWAAARDPDPLRSAESIRVRVLPRR